MQTMTITSRPFASRTALAAALAAAVLLAGCGDKDAAPTGQVVAKVDGQDITRRDVSAELTAAKAGPDIDLNAVQGLVVDKIVTRRLFVEEAKREGVDKTPEYLAAEQRARESVLAEMMVQRFTSKLTPPTADQVQAFIAANPQMFAERRVLQLDQIRTASAGLDLKALGGLNTTDAVIAWLQGRKHPFDRGQAAADTLQLPKSVSDQIAALPPGMPFVVNEGGLTLISTVVGQRPAPVPEAQWSTVATQALTRQQADTLLQNQLRSLRSGAKIEYQKGFAPPAGSAGAAAGAGAGAAKP